jgi:transitional endoplasmic reticulum ATPase
MPERTMTLKVMEADPNNVGKKLVALDVDTRNVLGLGPNDCVYIKAKKETLAKIWPARPSDEGTQIIRMDSFTRKNAGISLGDAVTVKKANVQPAKKVTFAPTQEINASIDQYTRNVKKNFLMKPVMSGEEVMFSVFGSPVFLIVQSTQPKGPVLINDETEVLLLNEVVDPNTTNVCQVSYDDIGGIKKQLGKIREMIELPLKHPEFFEHLGVEPPKGILMYGPPGTGKTYDCKSSATESGPYYNFKRARNNE